MRHPLIDAGPQVLRTRPWGDYALVDSGEGAKLERYGGFSVVRPEPQCLWRRRFGPEAWTGADAIFDPSAAADDEDGGRWRFPGRPSDSFDLSWESARFTARFTSFRHLAFFPEQAVNWDWLQGQITAARQASSEPPRILNLFGYTGVASLVCTAAGAAVTHVDASKKSVGWARENAALSALTDHPLRWIVEDAKKWVQREGRRGAHYDGIILDPPKYGRGPAGEIWRLFEDLAGLVHGCAALLSEHASFLLVNAYAARLSGLALAHLVADALPAREGRIEWGELALEEAGNDPRSVALSNFARWTCDR